jgi:hypothetical protein
LSSDDSEVALHSALQALQALAAAPEQYPALLASGSLPSLLDLLTHENTDIAAGVVALLAELMGEEEAGKKREQGRREKGEKGETGENGEKGYQGEKGEKGDAGVSGGWGDSED